MRGEEEAFRRFIAHRHLDGEKAEGSTKLEELKVGKRTECDQLDVMESKLVNNHKTCGA